MFTFQAITVVQRVDNLNLGQTRTKLELALTLNEAPLV